MSEESLHIEFQRSGGFAGVTLAASIDADELPPDDAGELRDLVDRLDLGALPAEPGPGRPDRFHYDLIITRREDRHQISIGEAEVPHDLRPLIDRLVQLARRG